MLIRLARGAWRLLHRRDFVRYRSSILPPSEIRSNGPEFGANEYFLQSAVAEARRLVERFECNEDSHVMDIGCGQGRLAIGLLREIGALHYTGFDVSKVSIDWCQKHIEARHPSFRFLHLDVENERYNPAGKSIANDFRFPLVDGQVDVAYLWSVFTNMRPEHMRIYLADIGRTVRLGGHVFLTAFVEKDVPAVTINPSNYVPFECGGPLHVVRYEEEYLFSTFMEHGLSVDDYQYRRGMHNQSEIYLTRVAGKDALPA